MNENPFAKNRKDIEGKSKRTKIIWIGISLVFSIILISLFFLNIFVKNTLEKAASNYLGTPVHIKTLSTHLFAGTIEIEHCTIETNHAFKQKKICTIDKIQIALDPSSLFSDTVLIHKIQLKKPHFYYEKDDRTSNFSALFQQIKKNKTPTQTKQSSKKINIKRINVSEFTIDATVTTHQKNHVQLKVEKLNFDLTTQRLHLENLTLTSPKKINTPHFFTLKNAEVHLNFNALKTDESFLSNIQLNAPCFFIEKNSATDTFHEYFALIRAFHSSKKTELSQPQKTLSKKTHSPLFDQIKAQNIQLRLIFPQQARQNIRANIKQLEYSVSSGECKLQEAKLNNPSTIKIPYLFKLQNATFQLSPNVNASTSRSFIIQHIHLLKPQFFLEHNYKTDSISEWKRVIQTLTKKTTQHHQIQTSSSSPKNNSYPLILKDIKIENIQLNLAERTGLDPSIKPVLCAQIDQLNGTLNTGNLSFQTIILKNPKGYLQPNILKIEKIETTFDPQSIYKTDRPILLHQLTIHSSAINLEQTRSSGNFIEWNQKLHHFFLSKKENTSEENRTKTAPSKPFFQTEKVLFNQIKIKMTSPLLEPKMIAKFVRKINPTAIFNPSSTKIDQPSTQTITLLSLEKFAILPQKGLAQIYHLNLANPPGFSNPNIFSAENTQIIFSTKKDPIFTINKILINKPNITYERKFSVDNFQLFPEFLMAAIRKPEQTLPKRSIFLPKQTSKKKKIIIKQVVIQKAVVHTKISKLPTTPLPLPQIKIQNIGTKENGTSPAEALSKIYASFYEKMMHSLSRISGITKTTLKNVTTFGLDTIGTFGTEISNTTKKILFFKKK